MLEQSLFQIIIIMRTKLKLTKIESGINHKNKILKLRFIFNKKKIYFYSSFTYIFEI